MTADQKCTSARDVSVFVASKGLPQIPDVPERPSFTLRCPSDAFALRSFLIVPSLVPFRSLPTPSESEDGLCAQGCLKLRTRTLTINYLLIFQKIVMEAGPRKIRDAGARGSVLVTVLRRTLKYRAVPPFLVPLRVRILRVLLLRTHGPSN